MASPCLPSPCTLSSREKADGYLSTKDSAFLLSSIFSHFSQVKCLPTFQSASQEEGRAKNEPLVRKMQNIFSKKDLVSSCDYNWVPHQGEKMKLLPQQ